MMLLYLLVRLLLTDAAASHGTNLTAVDGLILNGGNHTFTESTDESFQERELETPHRHCQRQQLLNLSHIYCGDRFHYHMEELGRDLWCQLDAVTAPYHEMTTCLEYLTNGLDCYYPNADTQSFFLYIHGLYFRECSKDELALEDAPHWLVMVLTLVPVSLIPVLVYLVVWKSKVQE